MGIRYPERGGEKKLAVVKLWNICKRSGRSNTKQMRDSTRYIMDEIKTALSIPMEISVLDETGNGMTEAQAEDLRDAMNEIRYLTNGKKTVEGFFTGAINCRLEHAVEDMEALKEAEKRREAELVKRFKADAFRQKMKLFGIALISNIIFHRITNNTVIYIINALQTVLQPVECVDYIRFSYHILVTCPNRII